MPAAGSEIRVGASQPTCVGLHQPQSRPPVTLPPSATPMYQCFSGLSTDSARLLFKRNTPFKSVWFVVIYV